MSDLFHEEVPDEFIAKVFAVIARNPRHDFLILTKRADRLSSISKGLSWPGNTWLGVSVESHSYLNRIDQLRKTTAKTKFISFEPLLGNVGGLDLSGIDWAIVGGESGWHARRMEESRVIGIKDQCQQQGVSFYFKQWGGTNKKKAGRILQSQTWDEMPLYRQDGVHRETTSVLKPIL
jgi:protein gp37